MSDPTARRRSRLNERARVPAPLLKRRLPSGRGATSQPNVTSDGPAVLSLRFWVMVLLTAVVTGLIGDALMLLLFSVQELAYGAAPDGSGFAAAVARADPLRRMLPLIIAGLLGAAAWYLLRRATPGEKAEVDEVLWSGEGKLAGRLSARRSTGTAVISEVVVGLGASLGREAAPKLMGAVAGSLIAELARLSAAQQRVLVACGAGAGLACVYNVPLGGALFTAEVLIGAITVPTVLPALVCTSVATATAWLVLPTGPIYLDVPDYRLTLVLVVWAALVAPLLGLTAAGYVRLVGWLAHHQLRGRGSLIALPAACTGLAVLGLLLPQLYGNGQEIAHEAFLGLGTLGLFLALGTLKPLVTAVLLGSGASGGLFTPVLSSGAALGAAMGLLAARWWPGEAVGAYALVAAAAFVGAAMQAPISAVALLLELTHSGFGLLVPMVLATAVATAVARGIDGYSIFSARLPSRAEPGQS